MLWQVSVTANVNGLNDISVKSSAGRWQIDLSLSGNNQVNYKKIILHNPERLVVDLEDTNKDISAIDLPIANTPISNIRVGYFKPTVLRVVVDLSRSLQSNVKQKTSGGKGLQITLSDSSLLSLAKAPKINTVASSQVINRQKDIVVVIDPGHGGKDPGAIGVKGTHEKDVVLSISKKLYTLINNQRGFKAYLTRDKDYYLTLRQRLAIARKYKADMFVAIHADAFHNKNAKGVSVFALSTKGATSEAARWLAEKENESELLGGVALSDKTQMLQSVLLNLSQSATIRSSLEVGGAIINSLQKFATMHDHKVDQASFVVLKSPDIPSLLIETGFLSNPQEEQRLRTSSYQYQVAKAIWHGVVGYFEEQPPRGTTLAAELDQGSSSLYHTVRRGDTLSAIALRYHVSSTSIKSVNNLTSNIIRVGQKLQIPARNVSRG